MKSNSDLEKERTLIINLFKEQNPEFYSQIIKNNNDGITQSGYEVKVVFSGTEGYEWLTERK